jgi:Flp pilus assembly protein TadG
MRWLARERRRSEKGVSGLVVLFCMVALFGSLGLVIDLGLVRQERRELQNGADAAALALAQDCALDLCTNLVSKAEPYADANAKDNASSVTAATQMGNTVKVDTRTETTSGAPSLTTQFAQLVGGPSGSTVRATATAGWSAPGGARTIPLTISFCEWSQLTGAGVTYPTNSRWIYFHDPKGPSNKNPPICNPGPAGQDVPGGFGWLTTDPDCLTTITVGNTVNAAPGNSPPNLNNSNCVPSEFLSPNTVEIPVFDTASGSGSNGTYTVYGLATFEMFHMQLASGQCGPTNWVSCGAPAGCSSSQRCIYGRFIKAIKPCPCGTTVGPYLGTRVVKLVA